MTATPTRKRHAQSYTLTDADRAYVAEASVAFRRDYRYLEQVLWTARSTLDRTEMASPAPAPAPPPPTSPAPPTPEQVAEQMATLEPRLARYVEVHPTGCLVWTGSLTGAGQPVLRLGPDLRVQQVRRWVWEQLHGPIPGKRRALSEGTCRPRCVRPDHVVILADGVRTRRLAEG